MSNAGTNDYERSDAIYHSLVVLRYGDNTPSTTTTTTTTTFPATVRSDCPAFTLLRCHGFAREFPSTRFRSRGSLRPDSRRRYYNATVSLGNFRRRGSEAEVRSGLKAVDATTMLRFRSGTSVDAVPKQRFAQA